MERQVVAIPERAVRLRVNGLVLDSWTCTPAALESLAVGRLVSAGFVRLSEDVLALRTLPPEDGILGIDAEVPPEAAAAGIEERDHRREHGCGPRFLLDCRPALIQRPPRPAPDVDAFPGLFREIYERSEAYRTTGGLHAAALSDGHRLDYLHEEVGRHNAVEKSIGAALIDAADVMRLGLVTTARISGQIAATAARAGVAWIASRSVPTTLAVEIARLAGFTIVARAPGRDARVFPDA